MIVPFFLTTRSADVLCTARIPAKGTIVDATLDLGAGGRHPRNHVFPAVTQELTRRGHAVFSMEYPGIGSGPPPTNFAETLDITADCLEALQNVTGLDSWSVLGVCQGALVGLSLAAKDPRIHTVVGFGCPFAWYSEPVGGSRTRRRLTRLTRFVRRSRANAPSGPHIMPVAVADLHRAARRSNVHLIYGTEDGAGRGYQRLLDSGQVAADVVARVKVHQWEGRLTGGETSASLPWMAAVTADALSVSAGHTHV